ncbi:HAD hydrolase-like protein [Mesorhizobium sp. ORM6]
MFEECIARAGTDRLLMVGDQIDTDIKGAKAAGLDALLVTTGLNNCSELRQDENGAADYVANNLGQIFDGSLSPHLRSAKRSSTTNQVWAAWSEICGADKPHLGGSG